MPQQYEQINTIDDLERVMTESTHRVVILFNHDPWCPISGRAFKEMARVDHDAALVDVSRARDVTAAIAERTGVRHESPQVLVLFEGREVWNASHFAITTQAVEDAARVPSASSD